MREIDVVRELRARLPEILSEGAVRWERADAGFDAAAEFLIGGKRLRLVFEAVAAPNLARLREKSRGLAARVRAAVPVIAAPHLSDEMRELCRQEGVGYVDLSGNVWLRRDPVVIRKDVARPGRWRAEPERNPFADRASLVLRYLLDKEAPQGVRSIAAAVGLDPGYVSRVLHAAEEQGYAALDEEGRGRLRHREEMLADWSAAYSWRRNSSEGYFALVREGVDVAEAMRPVLEGEPQGSYALSLHAGSNRIDPFVDYSVNHLYVNASEKRGSQLLERLRKALALRIVPPSAGNIVAMKPYYHRSVFFGARKVRGLWIVSDLQLWLDLRRFPIRGAEAADRILERRLRPMWSDER